MVEADQQKQSGAYYTPEDAVRALVTWAVRNPSDRLLDPSAGTVVFLALHRRSVGVEQDIAAAAIAIKRAPWALIHEGDFFRWAASTKERFECAAGNPPFIRYQHFSGAVRERALHLCESLGAPFSGLTSSWAPFLVATASLLKPEGRFAFVVPSEIGHAPYAQPLLEYLAKNFARVQLVAVGKKIFPELSEDVWLLYAEGFGRPTTEFLLTTREKFTFTSHPPKQCRRVSIADWRAWHCRLRSFLVSESVQDLYISARGRATTTTLGQIARVGIGYVTGANDFFHLRPSIAEKIRIPKPLLQPTVRNGRMLAGGAITPAVVRDWYTSDDAFLLLKLPKKGTLPNSVLSYLETPEGTKAQTTYKCRNREPWYSVPDVIVPDAFLSYMSGDGPSLVANRANCTCTNSVHTVQLSGEIALNELQALWTHPLTRLSCELEGHPLGGGLLKVEPREAQRIMLDRTMRWSRTQLRTMKDGISELQRWRHISG